MATSRATIGRMGHDWRALRLRRAGALLGVLALLIQLAAGMIPMPLAFASGNAEAAGADLCLAPDSPLAHRVSPADDTKGKTGNPAHDCQICLTLQLAGHFLPTVPAALAPQGESLFALLQPGESETPALTRHASAAPRAPPAIA